MGIKWGLKEDNNIDKITIKIYNYKIIKLLTNY
jgi:hypothetical protein